MAYKQTGVLAALIGLGIAAPALATNEFQIIVANSCTGASGCASDIKVSAKPGDPIGGLASSGYTSASLSGAGGGLVTSQSGFNANPVTLDGAYTSLSQATLTYTFQVQGAANTFVPLHIYGTASIGPIQASTEKGGLLTVDTEGMPSGYSFFDISSAATLSILGTGLFYDSTGPVGASVRLGNHLNAAQGDYRVAGQSAIIDQTVYFLSNTDINVEMSALSSLKYLGIDFGVSTFGSVMASADPTFTIDDPAFSAFSVVGVPTAAAAPGAVPEPATWAMFVGGFGLIGGAMRRRRKASVTFA